MMHFFYVNVFRAGSISKFEPKIYYFLENLDFLSQFGLKMNASFLAFHQMVSYLLHT